MIGDLVFVYGTLRRGCPPNPAVRRFWAEAEFVQMATLPGRLYLVDWYPGLVETGTSMVTGEVWRLTTDTILAGLDAYEGLGGPDKAEYARLRRYVETPVGPVAAWVYLYQAPVREEAWIASGNWLEAVNSPG